MQDAWRAYLELALGLTEASRKRAQTVARKLVGSSGATAAQLQELAEELVSTGLANREALTKIIRFEVDRALGVVGLATADEVAELTNRVRQLESELQEARAAASAAPSETAALPAGKFPAHPTGESSASVAKRVAVKKTAAKSAVAKKAVVKKTAAEQGVAKKAVAKKVAATPVVAKKAGPAPATESNSTHKPPPGTGAA